MTSALDERPQNSNYIPRLLCASYHTTQLGTWRNECMHRAEKCLLVKAPFKP